MDKELRKAVRGEDYSSEISPTRCNNCVLFSAMALLYMFRATISPIIRST